MQAIFLVLLTVATLFAAAYAHLRLPFHTDNAQQLWTGRIILLAIGVGFGVVSVEAYAPLQSTIRFMVFLSAFGLVHVPAAFILFLKRLRNRQGG
jgi:hypothetical protein